MMFGDDRLSTPYHNAEAIAEMMAEEQRHNRSMTTYGNSKEESSHVAMAK